MEDKILRIMCGEWYCDASSNTDINYLSPSLPVFAAFIKERKMGLNDFIQKLVSTPHICQQWVFKNIFHVWWFGWKVGTRSVSWRQLLPGSSIYFWSLAHSWSARVGQSNQPPEFGRTFCEKRNLGPRSRRGNKTSPFMTSPLTTSPLPNHLSCKSLLSPRRG